MKEKSSSLPPLYSLYCIRCNRYLGQTDNREEKLYCSDCYRNGTDESYDQGYHNGMNDTILEQDE